MLQILTATREGNGVRAPTLPLIFDLTIDRNADSVLGTKDHKPLAVPKCSLKSHRRSF